MQIEWDAWKGRISLHHVTACGHSFGAATVVEMLRHEDRFHYFSQGIIYDIWGAGTRPPEEKAPEHRLRAPLLAINSEAFTYWKSNFELVESLVDEAQSNPDPSPSWMMTVRGTIHISQSDFTLLYPHVCSLFLKAVANPQRAIDLNINASLEFLHRVLPADMAQASRSARNEELLNKDVSPLHEIPTSELHRPKDKWVGARIRIPHEYLYRISPKLFRKVKRYKAERNGEQDETGAEIWLHSKPSAEIISKHLYRTSSDSRTKQ
jgi:platelet-activating factor acetylhydrolase